MYRCGKDGVGFVMIHNKKTDIAIQGHEGKGPGAVVMHDAGILVRKCSETGNVGNRLVFDIRDESRLVLAVLVFGDESRHELSMDALGRRRAQEDPLGGLSLSGGCASQSFVWLPHMPF